MKIDYYKDLDDVLTVAKENRGKLDISVLHKLAFITIKHKEDAYRSQEIYLKLKKDGYLRIINEEDFLHGKPIVAELTLEGYLFINDGKYKQKNINDSASLNRGKKIELAIAIGTCLSGAYVLLQIAKWIAERSDMAFCGC